MLPLPCMVRKDLVCGVLVTSTVISASVRGEPHDGQTKRAKTATALAIGGSLVGPALIATAFANDNYDEPLHDAVVPLVVSGSALIVFGPSLGNWYAHEGWSTGLGLRVAGGFGVALGGSLVASQLFSSDASASGAVGIGLVLAGLGAITTGTVLDIVEAHRSVNTYNRKHVRRQLSITPAVSRAEGARHIGLAVVGTF